MTISDDRAGEAASPGAGEAADPGSAGEGLRERKKRLTRARLHRCALELTLERGLGAVTVDAIAEAADVSPRTFFNYFRSKESAILGLPDDLAERMEEAMRARPASEAPLASAQEVTRSFIEGLPRDRTLQDLRRAAYATSPELSNGFLQASAGVERALAEVTVERLAASAGLEPDAATPQMRMHAILVGMSAVAAIRATLAARANAAMDREALVRFFDEAFEHVRAGLPDPRDAER